MVVKQYTPKGVMNDVLILSFLEGYLVIARVTVEEGEEFVAGGGVYNLV